MLSVQISIYHPLYTKRCPYTFEVEDLDAFTLDDICRLESVIRNFLESYKQGDLL